MEYYKIGIDVGGTNTDCVLVKDNNEIIAKTKQPTTSDISTGIDNALKSVLKYSKVAADMIKYVMLGTTHCTNAIVERKHLNKVGVIRLCKPAALIVPPMSDFPDDLKSLQNSHVYMVKGGYEFDGRLISPIDENEIKEVLQKMKGEVDSIAITGIFSKINPDQELKVAELAKSILGEDTAISLSHQIGGLGLLERENATILNAMLNDIAVNMVSSFETVMKNNNVNADLYIGQNNGTLMSLANAKRFPILTIACGPTNSIRGAGALSGIKDGIVIDVGGTTSDAGVLVNQFPRESNKAASIGGIKTNFRMPDVVAIGLGGGTIIKSQDDNVALGPESVGYKITEEALCFGGDTYTLSDYAILKGKLNIPDTEDQTKLSTKVAAISAQTAESLQLKVEQSIESKINKLIDKVKTDNKLVPVVFVGGGSPILPEKIEGVSEIICPPHYEVANAYGACISQIGGGAEKVFNLASISREKAIEEVKQLAINNAVNAGARVETIEVLTVSDTPLAYLPNAIKVKVDVCGDLK